MGPNVELSQKNNIELATILLLMESLQSPATETRERERERESERERERRERISRWYIMGNR
jgi:hypothetical protein